jgi:hypothetical protein
LTSLQTLIKIVKNTSNLESGNVKSLEEDPNPISRSFQTPLVSNPSSVSLSKLQAQLVLNHKTKSLDSLNVMTGISTRRQLDELLPLLFF